MAPTLDSKLSRELDPLQEGSSCSTQPNLNEGFESDEEPIHETPVNMKSIPYPRISPSGLSVSLGKMVTSLLTK
ncbi:hypothetical protein PanWU01x14_339970 [Parasponia andersonii]|uniref:Uncharacterized protein n=1 Tax=Parasponia andersonii TaxID=3476 RepID=A0A2P5AEN7_PARAD|nr:hypothetical protein PanWU01x14_339970 [Parasponia andersonii]